MSSPSSDIWTSLKARMRRKILWIDTYYFNLTPHTIENMKYNAIWNSGTIRPKYFDFALEFQFARISKKEYNFTCIRTPVRLPPSNYVLEFHCSCNAFNRDPDVLVLESNRTMISQIYCLNLPFRHANCMTLEDYTTILELKVLVKMIEYDCESSPACKHQEQEFRKIKEKFFNEDSVLKELRYILHIFRVQDIFTGRQNNEFAEMKTNYILRTAAFSREIANYMKSKEKRKPEPMIDLGLILNYILNGELNPVDDQDLFKVYFEGYRMGLNFLVDLSTDVILDRISNENSMIEALEVAERVGDKTLFGKVAKKFQSYYKTEQFISEFSRRLKNSDIPKRFMFRSLRRQLRKKESKSDVETGESSQSSTPKQFVYQCVFLK